MRARARPCAPPVCARVRLFGALALLSHAYSPHTPVSPYLCPRTEYHASFGDAGADDGEDPDDDEEEKDDD